LEYLEDIRKQEADWEKKPVKRRAPKVFKYEGKDGKEKELSISEREKDAWLKRAMNQPLSDREERLLLKLNNNILILETDQKLKKWRIEKAALKDLLSFRQKQVESKDEELED
jgi:hypothetical protein